MKHIYIFLLALLPGLALAEPSQSSDSGRDKDTSRSSSIKRDQSLSADKARGNRTTRSDSRENSRETSSSHQSQERSGNSWDRSTSGSMELNVNSILMREFVRHYERTRSQPGMSRVQKVFADCKPVSGVVTEYPTLNSTITLGDGYSVIDTNHIVPRRLATHFVQNTGGAWGQASDQTGLVNTYDMPAGHPEVGRYARCRIIASKWVAEAGDRVTAYSARSETEVRQRITEVFNQMDSDDRLFERFRMEALELWQQADCAPTLRRWNDFQKPELHCYGVFVIDGNSIEVENQQTLSEQSIAGRSFKVSLEQSESTNYAREDSNSEEDRRGYSERESDQRERFAESKKTASMSKSKSSDRGSSSKETRSSGAGFKVVPKD